MIHLVLRYYGKLFLGVGVSPRVMITRFKVPKFLKLQISTLCPEKANYTYLLTP